MKRNAPDWLKKINNTESEQLESAEFGDENENVNKRRVTRSNSTITRDEPKPKINQCPFIQFTGAIKYYSTLNDIACACDDLLTWIQTIENDVQTIPIAFDMEWPFSFKTGPGKTAVIQLCAEENTCYVFSVGQMKKLPCALNVLLTHPKVILHGVNIKNDFRKLQRDFPETNADLLISKSLDLSAMCNEIRNTGGRWSLERLVNYVCQLQMDKSKKVRMSKWNVIPLADNQLMYAAIDVYIGQVIYRKLEQHQTNKTSHEIEQEILLKRLNLDL